MKKVITYLRFLLGEPHTLRRFSRVLTASAVSPFLRPITTSLRQTYVDCATTSQDTSFPYLHRADYTRGYLPDCYSGLSYVSLPYKDNINTSILRLMPP
jgi:hypothetical protein